MKILFLGRHYTYFRNFEGVLRELATRGHRLHLAVEQEDVLGGSKLVTALADEFPNVTSGLAPGRPEDDWAWTATRLRLGLDYLRYLHPTFDQAYKLRERARGRTPGAFVAMGGVVRAGIDATGLAMVAAQVADGRFLADHLFKFTGFKVFANDRVFV